MRENPLFSVITVSYNSGQFVGSTIESVLSQSFGEMEYIIGDDCSTDDTWDIIQQYHDERIKVYRNDRNLGEYANRNKALSVAKGDYVIFIDGDDIMYHYALETYSYYISHFPECGMICSRQWDNRIIYPFLADPLTVYRFEYLDTSIVGGNFTKVLFKRNAILEAGKFPSHIRTGDYYIQLKIALHHPALAINDGLTWWRRRSNNASSRLFRDNRYIAEYLIYRTAFLDDKACPLPEKEKIRARNNLYGICLRTILRMIVQLKFSEVYFLLKKITIPPSFYGAVFIKSRFDYFKDIKGDNPLHTRIASESILSISNKI